jgi:hypothetical protein
MCQTRRGREVASREMENDAAVTVMEEQVNVEAGSCAVGHVETPGAART